MKKALIGIAVILALVLGTSIFLQRAPSQTPLETNNSGDFRILSKKDGKLGIVTADSNTIIQYDEFVVPPSQEFRIEAPSEDSSIMIRVTSDKPVRIQGTLTTNCNVYFVTPGGFQLGPRAVISTSQH